MGLLGRAWVSSLPKFFLGKYFQFWKPPPLFCINSRDNVYYPIFLLKNGFHFFIWKMVENGIKCAFPGRRTYVLSVDNFSGKARERVFSLYLSTSPSIYPQAHQLNLSTALEPAHSHSASTTRQALLFSHSTTRQHSIALRRSDFTRDAILRASDINIP